MLREQRVGSTPTSPTTLGSQMPVGVASSFGAVSSAGCRRRPRRPRRGRPRGAPAPRLGGVLAVVALSPPPRTASRISASRFEKVSLIRGEDAVAGGLRGAPEERSSHGQQQHASSGSIASLLRLLGVLGEVALEGAAPPCRRRRPYLRRVFSISSGSILDGNGSGSPRTARRAAPNSRCGPSERRGSRRPRRRPRPWPGCAGSSPGNRAPPESDASSSASSLVEVRSSR